MRKAVLLLAALLLIPALLLGLEAARLPSASTLDAFLPDRPTTIPPQACRDVPTLVVPTQQLLPLEPALRAAEGPDVHYSEKIARTMLCTTGHHQILRTRLDQLLLAAKIRTRFTRQQRFTIFLNRTYFGGYDPGAAASAHRLFQHPPDQLTLPQRALLMGMIRSPIHYDQRHDPPAALARRNAVLDIMVRNGDITPAQAEAARQVPLDHQFDHAS